MAENTEIINKDKFLLDVSDDNMNAYLEIASPDEVNGETVLLQEVLDFLAKKGIVYGVNTEAVKEIVDNKKWGVKTLIAEGLAPAPGKNASLEFFFPTDKSCRPQVSEDGHIDYHELSIVNSVVKDALLIKKTVSEQGTAGKNVLGKNIQPIPVTDVLVQTGPGTYRDQKDPLQIKALSDGVIFFDSSKNYVEVQKMYKVAGNVDFSTGNINVKSSVEIQGDVKPGFSVKTPYNVQINGSVEQASIACEGTLKVNKGILGDSKQVISSNGDMHIGYVNNQILKCKGKMFIQTEIRNTIIECCDEITIVKTIGVILGGKIYVANRLTAANIGNKYNVATEIEIGMNFDLKAKHDQKINDIIALHKTIENVNKNISLISHSDQNDDNNIKLITLRDEYEAYVKKMDMLHKDLHEFEKEFYNVENPMLVVVGKIYPGVTLRLRHAHYDIKEELSHIKFVLENGEIVIKKL